MSKEHAVEKPQADNDPVKQFGMYLAHVGVNAGSEDEVMEIVEAFDKLLGLKHMNVAPVSEFAGDFVEVMKPGKGRGEKGHLGFHVDDVDAAARWYEQERGCEFDWNHAAKNPDGSTHLVYFKQDIAGFAIHLTEQR